MGKITEEFEQFYQAECGSEPAALQGLIDGWDVLESHGSGDRRVLLIQNATGEKRILKQFPHEQNARMRAELLALNAAQEPGIPKLFDYAEDESYVYLVREYVEGFNLEEWVAQHGKASLTETARIGCQLCEVLERLHRRNIIHRDVKPQNVIITPDGRVYLIDFDISRRYTEGESHDTEYLGTRNTAPPEQFGYGQTDARTDIYSLGVVLLYLATGSYNLDAIARLPRPLRGTVRRCTRFAPARRYRTAAQLRRRLCAIGNHPRRLVLIAAVTIVALAFVLSGVLFFQPREHVFPKLVTLAADAPVTFREPLIEQCVRAQLHKPAGVTIFFGELSAVSEVYLYGDFTDGAVHDLNYQGNQVYVGELALNHGNVLTLSDLLMMPNLRVLRLFRQPLSDVDALAPLVKLEELYLDESTNIRNIAAVAKLNQLRTLDISDTAVSDLSPLAGCPRLRQINLERIPCENFSVLSRYPYLKFLNVNEASPNAVIAAVSGKMIDYLWLDYSGLTDIKPFLKAESVEQLHAKHNQIRSLKGIEALTMLEYVDVAYNPIADLSPLLALPRLKALRIDPNLLTAWEQIRTQANFSIEWETETP